MLFNSLHYLIFLPIVVGLYYLLPHRWRWLLLLVASYYFYMCWKAEYAVLLLFSTGVAYIAGLRLADTKSVRLKKIYLWVSIGILLAILFLFKYFNFASGTLRHFFDALKIPIEVPFVNLLLPIGISFYTFQKISYIVDVYHGKAKAEKHFGIFAVYSCFFPQLVAGPIERARHLLHQFYERHEFSSENAKAGLQLILWGFFKKVVVADRLSIFVKTVYSNPHDCPGLPLIVATIFFAFQIYCDFSGYTDIAIGSARLMGFDLMANFRQPYFAKSLPEFWHRWHISLSTWFRDYLYIPLGGSRVVKWRWYYNLFITFFISGLWHGANWTFAAWGTLHGCYMIVDSFFGPARDRFRHGLKSKVSQFSFDGINLGLTFCLVTLAWIPFRANNFNDAWYIVTHLFSGARHWLDFAAVSAQFHSLSMSPLQLVGSIIHELGGAAGFRGLGVTPVDVGYAVGFIALVIIYDIFDSRYGVWPSLNLCPRPLRWAVYYILLGLLLFFGPYNQAQNFIYFQF